MPDQARQHAEELRGGDDDLPVLRPDRAGGQPGVGELIGLRVGEAHGEGANRLPDQRRHEGSQSARIDPAGQEQPERHVAHEVAPDSLREAGTHLAPVIFQRQRRAVRGGGQLPVATFPEGLTRGPQERPSRQELAHPTEEGLLPGDEPRREELGNDRLVQHGANGASGQYRLDLRRKQQLIFGPGVVERLDPEPVPRQQETPAGPVPQREREHALEPLDAALPFLLVEMQDGLGVAAGPIRVATLLESGPERGVVVDFAVVDDPRGPILVGHRLTASGHIHDGEPAHAEPHGAFDPEPLPVGPAVAQDVAHPLEAHLVHGFPRVQLDDADDPAHQKAATRGARRADSRAVTAGSIKRSNSSCPAGLRCASTGP